MFCPFPGTICKIGCLLTNICVDIFAKIRWGAADWVYFWALYSIPFVYLSAFVPAPHWAHRCGLYIFILRSGTVLAPALLSLRVILTSQDFLCFHPNFKILFSSSENNITGIWWGLCRSVMLLLE